MITQAELKERFNYDPETGIFTSKKTGKRVGYKGSTSSDRGYLRTKVNNKNYLMHRLAWLYMYGEDPNIIDHINGIKTDNRISNLRNANSQINNQNLKNAKSHNISGYLGVNVRKNGKFGARIQTQKGEIWLGTFDCPKKAHEVYLKAKAEFHEGYVA